MTAQFISYIFLPLTSARAGELFDLIDVCVCMCVATSLATLHVREHVTSMARARNGKVIEVTGDCGG